MSDNEYGPSIRVDYIDSESVPANDTESSITMGDLVSVHKLSHKQKDDGTGPSPNSATNIHNASSSTPVWFFLALSLIG